jgi:glucosamine-6-phosphate deaminase
MKIVVNESLLELGQSAGKAGAEIIRAAILRKGSCNVILATGTSQFETLNQLIAEPGIDWSKVSLFHLDEYIGLPMTHPASFRKYLTDRFISKVPKLKAFYLIDGETDPSKECKRLGDLILAHPIDVAFIGIGENGHLAFNDPPADFDTEIPYIVVELDEACRKQQLGEGWFPSLEAVPKSAISMSIKQLLKSKTIICSVPDLRKAQAVKDSIENPISNQFPGTVLQQHPDCTCYLDLQSASFLDSKYH